MHQKLIQKQLFGCVIEGPAKILDRVNHNGLWTFEYLNRFGRTVEKINFRNGITDVGVASVYDCAFHAGAQITAWFIGLIDNSGYTALAAADTMASHTGWNEFTTYTEADRIAWDEAATAARTITSATAASFSISGSGTVKGAFLVSNATKAGTTGVLWSTGVFSSPPTVANGETLKVTYSLTG